MNNNSKIHLLQKLVNKQRDLEEHKKDMNLEKGVYASQMEDRILNSESSWLIKESLLKAQKLETQIKDINKDVNKIKKTIINIIMDEGDFDGDQLTIEDIINGEE